MYWQTLGISDTCDVKGVEMNKQFIRAEGHRECSFQTLWVISIRFRGKLWKALWVKLELTSFPVELLWDEDMVQAGING